MNTFMRKFKSKVAVIRHFRYLKDYNRFKKMVKGYQNSDQSLTINSLDIWKKKLLKVSKYGHTFLDISNDFFSTHMSVLKEREFEKDEPILICVIKNDLDRVKPFLTFYRNMGIKHFAFLDDQSSDGTREFLLKQDDVDVFISKESYTTNRRQAWINRLIAYYGLNRWYLVFDSDEFLSVKYRSIKEMITSLGEKTKYRCLMVDMYPLNGKYSENFIEDYRGFDTDTYDISGSSIWFNDVRGGMRKRMFAAEGQTVNPYLIKSPIFKADKDFIQIHSHFNYPFSIDKDFVGIIRHYKFLKKDFEKYQERAKKQNFSNGSEEYSAYANKLNGEEMNIAFKYDGSEEFIDYHSFYKIKIYERNQKN